MVWWLNELCLAEFWKARRREGDKYSEDYNCADIRIYMYQTMVCTTIPVCLPSSKGLTHRWKMLSSQLHVMMRIYSFEITLIGSATCNTV